MFNVSEYNYTQLWYTNVITLIFGRNHWVDLAFSGPSYEIREARINACVSHAISSLSCLFLSHGNFNARIHHAAQQHGTAEAVWAREQEQRNKFGKLWCGINGVSPPMTGRPLFKREHYSPAARPFLLRPHPELAPVRHFCGLQQIYANLHR